MGTPGKGMLLEAGPGRVMLTSTGKRAIVQASGTCCECACCIGAVYACICDQLVAMSVGGASVTVDVSECCDCAETPVELEIWVTCAQPDPPTIPITFLVTLNWEFRCGDDTPVTGSASVDDLCDAETVLEDVITGITGCTFNDKFATNPDDLLAWCYECEEGCCEFYLSIDSDINEVPGSATFTLDKLLICQGDTVRIDFTVESTGIQAGPSAGICALDEWWDIVDYSSASLTWRQISPFPPPGTFSTECLVDPDYENPANVSASGWVLLRYARGNTCPVITLFSAEARYQHYIYFTLCE